MIDIPRNHDGMELHIADDGRVWVNNVKGCLLRAGVPKNGSNNVVVIDDREQNKKANALVLISMFWLAMFLFTFALYFSGVALMHPVISVFGITVSIAFAIIGKLKMCVHDPFDAKD